MGDFEIPLRPVPGSVKELRDESRRDRQDRERGDAMLRAEEAGRAAADDQPWSLPEESRERFGVQLTRMDERTGSMPRVDAVLKERHREEGESNQLRDSLRDVERAELRLEPTRADGRPAEAQGSAAPLRSKSHDRS